MIGRRAAIAGAGCAVAGAARAAALPVPPGHRLGFDVMRRGSKIGEHAVTFEVAGAAVGVWVTAEIALHLGPIRIFHYQHHSVELWREGTVGSIQSRTDDDGSTEVMTALHSQAGLAVEGTRVPRFMAPPGTVPGSHWNRAMLERPFLNTQDGRLMRVTVTPAGSEPVPVAGGMLAVNRFRLRGDIELETWYDLSDTWAGLRFTAKDGSEVSYRRTAPLG